MENYTKTFSMEMVEGKEFSSIRSLTNYVLNNTKVNGVDAEHEVKAVSYKGDAIESTSYLIYTLEEMLHLSYTKMFTTIVESNAGDKVNVQSSTLGGLVRQAKLHKQPSSDYVVHYFDLVGDKLVEKYSISKTISKKAAKKAGLVNTMEMVKINKLKGSAIIKVLSGNTNLYSTDDFEAILQAENGVFRDLIDAELIENVLKFDVLEALKEAKLVPAKAKGVTFPIGATIDGVKQILCVTEEEARGLIARITIDGKPVEASMASSSQARKGTGFYFVLGDKDTAKSVVNVASKGHYIACEGAVVTSKDVSRIMQNSSSSVGGSVNLIEEGNAVKSYTDLTYKIIDNTSITIEKEAITLDKLGNSITKVVKMTKLVGDGFSCANEKGIATLAHQKKYISDEELEYAHAVEFDLTDARFKEIFAKGPKAYQTRPAKSMLIYVPKDVMAKYGHDTDIVFTKSTIKGKGVLDTLSVVNVAKRVGENVGRTNVQLIQTMGLQDKASRIKIADYLTGIKFNTLSQIFKKREDNLDTNRFIDQAIRTDKLNTVPGMAEYPYMIAKQVSQEIERDFEKVELECSEQVYIVDDPIFVLSGGKETMTTDEGAVTRRAGKCLVHRPPATHQSSALVIECHGLDNVKEEHKSTASSIVNDWNIFIMPLGEFVYYIDGADQDGDKILVIWEADHPILFQGNQIFTRDNLPFYIEEEGELVEMKMTLPDIHEYHLSCLFKDNGIGKLVNTSMTLLEAVCIKHDEFSTYRGKGDKEGISRTGAELTRLYDLLKDCKIANNLAIDGKLSSDMENRVMDDCSKPVFKYRGKLEPLTINGTQRNLTRCEHINGNVSRKDQLKGLETKECTSIIALMKRKEKGMLSNVLKLSMDTVTKGCKLNRAYNNILKLNGVSDNHENKGVINQVVKDISDNFNYEVALLLKDYEGMDGSIYDEESFFTDFRDLSDSYKLEFGDIVRDWRYGLAALNLCNQKISNNLSKVLSSKQVIDANSLRKTTSGCSFAFNVFDEALLNIGSSVKIKSNNDILVSEGRVFELKLKGKTIRPTLTKFQTEGIYPLKDGVYRQENGEVLIPKSCAISKLDMSFETDEVISDGVYYVHVNKDDRQVYISEGKKFNSKKMYIVNGRRAVILKMYHCYKNGPTKPLNIKGVDGGFVVLEQEIIQEEQTISNNRGKKFSEILKESYKENLEMLNATVSENISVEGEDDDYEVVFAYSDGEETEETETEYVFTTNFFNDEDEVVEGVEVEVEVEDEEVEVEDYSNMFC